MEDKRIWIDVAEIQECIEEESVDVRWVESKGMLADSLTKKGARSDG